MSLYWRIFAINAVLLVAAALTLAISPATVSSELLVREVLVLAFGLALVLVLNFLLVRRTLDPLERLTEAMRRADLLAPRARLPASGGGREVLELTAAFNEMLDRLEEERRESGRRAIGAQEHERRRIALELHDEVGQLLTGVVLSLDALGTTLPEEARTRVGELQGMVREGAEQVREIARGLRPESLEELGLRSALIGLTAAVADRTELGIRREIDVALPALSAETELVVYRIAQESLTNVVRHARARQVEVALGVRGDVLELRIADDGEGLNGADLNAGRGISGMRERAAYTGATLDVGSRSVGGTEVKLRVPLA
ncbi:MAG TPA: HAMP domain-containing sensor histidine kinase [Solirubrobacteraceae bacterium]|nr:HAMP domain-containing sensor histidine kinase [Solirubrobacteraceae bacterium]